MAWGAATVNTWYENRTGRVSQNRPFSLLEHGKLTREPNLADFDVLDDHR